jgi:predicted enzyme related to lactoylglutathione lyase
MFGWKFQDMKMPGRGVYMMFTTSAKNEGGGIAQNPMPGAPNAWLQYIGVTSVKKAMAKAAKLGATILVEYQPIESYGALGIFADPTGATCAVWEPAPKPTKAAAKKGAKKAAKKAAKKSAKKAAKTAAKKAAKKRA